MIHVIAIITARRGQRDSVLEAFRANMAAVKAEKGCLQYEGSIDSIPMFPFQAEFGPETFVVMETWESLEAFKAHSISPHMMAYAAKTRDMVSSRVIHVLSPV